MIPTGSRQCFISYAHEDHEGFDRLLVHLKPVAHLLSLSIWHDKRLKPGDYWHTGIAAEIRRSQIFVMLTTNDFLGSDYILKHELPAIRDEHASSGALVVPVIYRDCAWSGFFGSYIQATPMDAKGRLRPVMDWPKPENGFAAVSKAFQAAVVDWFGVAPRSPFASLPVPTP